MTVVTGVNVWLQLQRAAQCAALYEIPLYENRDEIDRFHARNHRLPLDYCITIDFVFGLSMKFANKSTPRRGHARASLSVSRHAAQGAARS